MKRIFSVLFSIALICYGLTMTCFSEETAATGIRLETFLNRWDHLLIKDDGFGSYIHTGIFMTNDEWHYGLITPDGKIIIDLFIDDNNNNASINSGQIMIHNELKEFYSELRNRFQAAIQPADYAINLLGSIFSDYNPFGFYEASHAYEYYSIRFVAGDSKQINVYGENKHLISYVYETTDQKNSIYGQSVSEFVNIFLPDIDAAQIDNYINHQRIEELMRIYGNILSDEDLSILKEKIESDSIDYIFPYSDTITVKLECNPATGKIRYYSFYSSVMGGEELFRQYLQLFFDISSCSLPIQTIDILAKMNGEEFTWRDVESIRDYPVGHVWTTMYLCDEDWCLCIKDDQNGIPGITFYMYDERYEKNNGMIW